MKKTSRERRVRPVPPLVQSWAHDMTKAEWVAEVSGAITSAGRHWSVFCAVVEGSSPMAYAEITDSDGKNLRRISLARDRFSTPTARRTEILRQLKDRR